MLGVCVCVCVRACVCARAKVENKCEYKFIFVAHPYVLQSTRRPSRVFFSFESLGADECSRGYVGVMLVLKKNEFFSGKVEYFFP